MTVQLRLCRRHGGRLRWIDMAASGQWRCIACGMERRMIRKKMERGGVKVPYEVQVDPRPQGWTDGWQTLEEHPTLEGAVKVMDRLQAEFPHAKLRVINVVRETERKEGD